MTNYVGIFVGVLTFNVGITIVSSDWYKKRQQQQSSDPSKTTATTTEENSESQKRWMELLKKYLIVYLLATLSDWMQGPYVYALYNDGYGYKQHDIAVLFVAGFGSSMIFGSFVGGMADAGGRRAFVILFSVIYALSCMTKRTFYYHISMNILLLFVIVKKRNGVVNCNQICFCLKSRKICGFSLSLFVTILVCSLCFVSSLIHSSYCIKIHRFQGF